MAEKRIRLTPEQKETIKSMSEKKIEQRVIAETIGCTKETVGYWQKKFGIPASNRYGGGMVSSTLMDPEPFSVRIPEKYEESTNIIGVTVAEKVVTLVGTNTTFLYTIGTKMNSCKITTNNASDIVIELKDLVAFGNEILDVADKIQEMKGNSWSV